MSDFSKEAAAIVEKHIDQIDEDDFHDALCEAIYKNLLDELLDLFEKAGIHLTKEKIEEAKEKQKRYLELSAKEIK